MTEAQAPMDITLVFEVTYDTPQGTVAMKVLNYTEDAVKRGVRCQIGHRAVGEMEKRSAPISLEEALQVETTAAVLDGENLYLRLIDHDGRDLAVSKIDEARWPRDATPTTVKTVAYWLSVPPDRLGS